MPVAVAAGLTHPPWRELSHITAQIPTDRIILVDIRNLDPLEKQLTLASDATIAATAQGFPGNDLQEAVSNLSRKCDLIYLHIDSDILDEVYTPNHKTKEPNGPNIKEVQGAIDIVMGTGKVVVYSVVSVFGEGDGADIMIESGKNLIMYGLGAWKKFDMG
jgi:arginase